MRDGAVWVRGVPDKRLSITEIFKARFGSSVGSMFGGHCFKTEGGLNPKTGKGKRRAAFWFFSACGVEVEVDRRLAKCGFYASWQRRTRASDSIPNKCELQNEGSMLSGMGSALF